MKGFNIVNVGLVVVGAILITAGIKGVHPKQVITDSVGAVKGGKGITIGAPVDPQGGKATPVANPAIATRPRAT